MRVSVVIPCWNAEAYLAQALGSVLEQTQPVHEVVVVDDGSTDASLEVAQRFEAGHPELVRVFSQRSGNAALTRNLGAQIATGDALLFLDADDVLGPDAVAGLVEALRSAPAGVAIGPWFRLELEDGRWVRRPPSCAPRRPGQSPLSAWLVGWYHPPCSVLWSRDAFERVGRFDELSTNDDGDLMMRALADGVPLAEATRGAGYYRRMPQGETSFSAARLTRRGLESRIRTVLKVVSWLERRQQLDAHRDAVSRALEMLADDAGTHHPDIRRSAEALARRYGSPAARSRRALRRAWRAGPGAQQPVRSALAALRRGRSGVAGRPPGRADAQEIRFGLTAAEKVLPSSPPAAPRPAPAVRRPVVSVVIPTYNRGTVLRRTLQGVLAQTVRDLEVLVVDDGSTDGTPELLAGCADPRVRYLRQPRNAGVGAARNRGLREARGEFIAFLDDDDEWLPTKLARQLECFAGRPDTLGLVYTGVEDHDGAGGVVVRTPTHRGQIYRDMLVTNVLHGAPSSALMRRCVVATAGFFDEDLVAIEDYDYWVRVTRFFDVDLVEEPLVRYHDPRDAVRRSVDAIANREARAAFFARYEAEMRRAGVRHLFLVRSSIRHLQDPVNRRGARRLALRALRLAPTALTVHAALVRSVAPGWVRRPARRTAQVGAGGADAAADGLVVLLYSAQPRLDRGGVQDVCARLSAGLRERGHTVVEAGPDVDQVAPPPVATLALVRPLSRRWRVVPRLLAMARSLLAVHRALRRWRPDVVNLHFVEGHAAYFLLLQRLFRFSVVLSAHGSDLLLHARGSRSVPRLLPRADAITAVSEPVAARVGAFPGVDPDRLHLITNGVDLDFWAEPPTAPRAEGERRGCTVVTVGRLHPVKGFDVLVDAMRLVRERVPTARLVLIGAGDQEQALRDQVRASGLDDAVVFRGHLTREGVRDQLRDADAFVLPSRSEGMPLSLLEAMATGLAPVATSVGGVPDVLVPGTGVLVPPEDPVALAEALAPVLSDRGLRDELASRAQDRARQFSATSMYDAYEELFQGLAARRPTGDGSPR
ncbi:glycosyltransferase [Blastococcus montanus]|uniref:glycosyltransferase n=1 Tax=Blastococcus montanus TaxID=3144973 RepID=UPI00320B5479